MSRSIQVVIAPSPQSARILVTEGPERTLLKAQLAPQTGHPRALPWLLEALALWEGTTVHAVLAVDEWDASCANTLYRDAFADSGTPPLYSLDWIPRPRSTQANASNNPSTWTHWPLINATPTNCVDGIASVRCAPRPRLFSKPSRHAVSP
jgi:hypothetical protein